jgi:redox-sensing transcriptional repressor
VAEERAVPIPALERLATYIRCLMQLEQDRVLTVSSQEMQSFTGVGAAQFRKDLSYLGEFGKRGIGYDVVKLRERIAHELRVDRDQPVLLVGAGHLGSALIAYPGWRAYHFFIAAVFDKDPAKIGTTIRRLGVQDVRGLATVNARVRAALGIIAVPAAEAQSAADQLVEAGVTGLMNFAPVRLEVPAGIVVRDVCFICELVVLSCLNTFGVGEADGSGPVAVVEESVVHRLADEDDADQGDQGPLQRQAALDGRKRHFHANPGEEENLSQAQ